MGVNGIVGHLRPPKGISPFRSGKFARLITFNSRQTLIVKYSTIRLKMTVLRVRIRDMASDSLLMVLPFRILIKYWAAKRLIARRPRCTGKCKKEGRKPLTLVYTPRGGNFYINRIKVKLFSIKFQLEGVSGFPVLPVWKWGKSLVEIPLCPETRRGRTPDFA